MKQPTVPSLPALQSIAASFSSVLLLFWFNLYAPIMIYLGNKRWQMFPHKSNKIDLHQMAYNDDYSGGLS